MTEQAAAEGKTNGVTRIEMPEVPEAAELRMVRSPEKVLADNLKIAVMLKEFLDKTGAVQRYGDHDHVMNQGWQFLARMFRATAVNVGVEYIERRDAHGYEATSEVIDKDTGRVISRGVGLCMTDEANWRERPKYKWVPDGKGGFRRELDGMEAVSDQARSSMAQTRANSKCISMILKDVVCLGGYAPTPAEEMNGVLPKTGSSEKPRTGGGGAKCGAPATTKPPTKQDGPVISAKQWSRMWAIYKKSGKSKAQMAELIGCSEAELYVRSKQLAVSKYDVLIEKLKKEGEK